MSAGSAAKRNRPRRAEKVRRAGLFAPFEAKLKQLGWINEGEMDKKFLIVVFILLAIGLVMMFSASYVASYYKNGNSYVFIREQMKYAVFGVVIMFAASKFNVRYLNAWPTLVILGVTLLLLVAVLQTEADDGGTKRRIFGFQPSEIAKFTLVLFMAHSISKQRKYFTVGANEKFCFHSIFRNEKYGERIVGNDNGYHKVSTVLTFYYLAIVGVFCLLVLLERHLSCTILLFLIGISMMACAGVHPKWFVMGFAVIAVCSGVLIFICSHYEGTDILVNGVGFIKGYQIERIVAWIDKSYEPTGGRWQINNSIYAIASGGPFGLGFGESRQKQMFVSEPQNDFIFAIVCEELGYVGAIVIILLFATLILLGYNISVKSKDLFSSLLVLGIIAQVGFQVVLNILVVTDMMPNTGISLPFFSYGGSSLVMLMGEMGLVLSVSKDNFIENRYEENNT